MIDFKKELDLILRSDPLNLLQSKPIISAASSSDRLISSFEEINIFYNDNHREPLENSDISERRLHSRLKGIRSNPEKIAELLPFDRFHLLNNSSIVSSSSEIASVDDVLSIDTLGLLNTDADHDDIFKLKNVRRPPTRVEHSASRKSCKDFAKFEPIFKQTQSGLSNKVSSLVKFDSELQIQHKSIFLLHGMLVFVAEMGEKEKKNFGNVNARLRCIFENGTESRLLLRSLAAALWKDENSRQVVSSISDNNSSAASQTDTPTGYIYVLRSKSQDPKILNCPNLFKIGFSRSDVSERISSANLEPTYLLSDVHLVTQFEIFNVDPQKFEALVHRFLKDACLNIDVYDSEQRRLSPREWFMVPLRVIEQTVGLIANSEILHYEYDHAGQCLVEKK